MSDADIDKAVKEAAEYEAQDKKRKEAIDTKNDADAFAFQTENALKEVGDKVSDSDKSQVEADIKALRDLLDKNKNVEDMTDADINEIKAAREKLEQSAQGVFTKMYEAQAQAAQGAQGAGPQAGPQGGFTGGAGATGSTGSGSTGSGSDGSDDGVVDADFKEV